MNILSSYKKAFSSALAVCLAAVASFYFSLAEHCWMVLTAILVMQTAVGVTLRQGVQRYIMIVLALSLGSLISKTLPFLMKELSVILFFTGCCYLSIKKNGARFFLDEYLLMGFIFLVAVLLPITHWDLLYYRLSDVTIGAIIGIVVNVVIFPWRIDVEFRRNIIPVLLAYGDYIIAIENLFLKNTHSFSLANQARNTVESKLQTHSAFFPVWIYEPGFSQSFQAGHRHFLLLLERVGQILFVMHLSARHVFAKEIVEELREPFIAYCDQAKHIFNAMVTVFELKRLEDHPDDLENALNQFDTVLNKILPDAFELLDLSQDYILLVDLATGMRDLHLTLVKLAETLYTSVKLSEGALAVRG